MAVLFSVVTAAADESEAEFLVGGIPRDCDDLEGWAIFEDFLDELNTTQEIRIHVEVYAYGDGEMFKASPEEVAYFTMRCTDDPGFLSRHCDNIEDLDFSFIQVAESQYENEIEM